MRRFLHIAVLACSAAGHCWAARCTTVLDPAILREYDNYVAAAERAMPSRFDAGDLSWMPAPASAQAAASLMAGKLIRSNISDVALNQRIAGQNGAVLHWIGAIRIPHASLADLRSVLEDYGSYERIYKPLVFACQTKRTGDGPDAAYDAVMGLRSAFRFASVFPQHYAFQVTGHIAYSGVSALRVHLAADEIRESDSGEPGHADFLQPYHDHGIMWALNAYWRARPRGPDIYLEFESITLARSVEAFACTLGFVPVPKAVVSSAMEALPQDTLTVILEATRAECRRRSVP